MLTKYSENKVYNALQDGINRRFFIAVEHLIRNRRFKSISEFCIVNSLNRARYCEMTAKYGTEPTSDTSRYKTVETLALLILANKYGISPTWLLCGKGNMM